MVTKNKARKNDKIVSNVIIKEEIMFQAKVITNDIGFQLMFGFDTPTIARNLKDVALKEYNINHKI